MKTKNILFLSVITIGCSFFSNHANSQTKEILIGHKIPDVELKEIVNYKYPSARISDFRGKLLILDFWATYCSPCVRMFPKTDSLEKIFKGRVQFLLITKEPKNKVISFFEHLNEVRHIQPFSVVSDTLFHRFFYYSTIPFYVWIDGNGKVIATTGSEEITEQNIAAILSGEKPSFANRIDIRKRNIDIKKSLFKISDNFIIKDTTFHSDSVDRHNIFSYSIATKYIDNATNGQFAFDMGHFSVYNISIEYLYRLVYDVAYYELPVHGAFDSKINHVFEIKNKELLNKLTITEGSPIKDGTLEEQTWAHNNAVCYEIFYPANLAWKEEKLLLYQDLDRYFGKPMGFNVHVEKRIDSNTVVLKIVGISKKMNLLNTNNSQNVHDRYAYIQHDKSLDYLTSMLNGYYFQGKKIFFLNETGIKTPVDLTLKCDMYDLNSINNELVKYGLKFIKEPTKIDVLVFTDNK